MNEVLPETLVYVPFLTLVEVQVSVGANYKQKVTIVPQSGGSYPPIEGAGGENKEIGHWMVPTTAPEPGKQGFLIKVTVENNNGSGWKVAPMVLSRPTSAATFTAFFLVSEDSTDNDWNDCVVMFSWSKPFGAAAVGAESGEGASG
ncbi:MAG: fucose-binding lectin II [Solirubrobacterales bacterium]